MNRTGRESTTAASTTRAWPTHVALLLVQIAFASQSVEAKVAMMPRAEGGEEIFPAALAMLRMIGGAVFFQAVVRACGLQTFPIPRADHLQELRADRNADGPELQRHGAHGFDVV